jgi:O-acetyl-ADP-ribose deacetylase (regulator of RNase III)
MIRVVVGDVATLQVDAVVRPATIRLEPLDHVGRHLDETGGEALATHRTSQQSLEVGAAVVTTAGGLGAEFVIHAVLASDTETVTPSTLRRAIRSALERAEQWEIEHVAFPPLGAGAAQLDFDEAARALVDCLRQHSGRFPAEVSLVVESEEERGLLEALLGAGRR